jgi:hypothetical protein
LAIQALSKETGKCGDSVDWEYDAGTKTLTLTGTGPTENTDDNDDESMFKGLSEVQIIKVEKGITTIDQSLFYQLTTVKTIHLPESLTKIDDSAFAGLTGLETIYFKGRQDIADCDSDAFNETSAKVVVYTPYMNETFCGFEVEENTEGMANEGEIEIAGTTINYEVKTESKEINITLPEGVTEFPDYPRQSLFAGLSDNIETVILPSNVKTLGKNMFAGLEKLKIMILPTSLENIRERAFYGCSALESISFESPSARSTLETTGIKRIEAYSFAKTGLKEITIPATITHIGNYSFADCEHLKKLTYLGDADAYKNLYIGEYVFGNPRSSILTITLPNLPDQKDFGGESLEPESTETPTPTPEDDDDGLSPGAIAAIVIAVVVVVAIIVAVVYFLVIKKNNNDENIDLEDVQEA